MPTNLRLHLQATIAAAPAACAAHSNIMHQLIFLQVGVGVLGLPYAFSYLGWTGGFVFLGLCFMTSLYTSYLLAALHEGPDGTRRNRYKDLGQAILGKLPDRQNLCSKVTGRPAQRDCIPAALLWDVYV